MYKKRTYFIFVIVFFCHYNFAVFAETMQFSTVRQILANTGNKGIVKKLVITGTISGNDYSDESDWSKFRTLDETFPNIETVKTLTVQDIPDFEWDYITERSLF